MLLRLFVIRRQRVEVVPRATHTVLRWLDLRDLTQHANVLPLVLLIVPRVLPRGFGVCVASFQHVNKLRTVQPKTVALCFCLCRGPWCPFLSTTLLSSWPCLFLCRTKMVSCSTNCQIHSLGHTIFGGIVLCGVPLLHKRNICGQRDSVLHLYLPWRLLLLLLPVPVLASGIASGRCFVCRSSSSSTSSRTRFAVIPVTYTCIPDVRVLCVVVGVVCSFPSECNLLSSDRFAIFPARIPVLFSLDDLFDLNHHLLQSAGLEACRFVFRSDLFMGFIWEGNPVRWRSYLPLRSHMRRCLSNTRCLFPFACIWPPCLRATLQPPAC